MSLRTRTPSPLALALGLTSALTLTACGDTDADTDTTSSESSDASTSAADTTAGGDCPLSGMFVACETPSGAGLQYCSEVEGELMWGPCVQEPACELGESLPGCQDCELVDGVPMIIGSAQCVCEGPVDPPVCEHTQCVQRWEWSCDDCQTITGGGDCLAYGLGCTSPQLSCTLDRPCSRVWAQTSNGTDLNELESVMAAECVLTSLRDDVPGEFEIIWGEMGDAGWAQVNIYSGGNGSVFMQWLFNCPGCYNFGIFGRSGMLALQPTSYFDDCLADPTPANLISCVVGDIEFQYGQPPPKGYVPPFTTGECSTLETVCP